MQQKESYDVLRLIEHGQICYISSENVQGRTLARYLKYHPVMEKKEMFLLLKAIAEQLELIHRCRGNPCYQYVNPYSVIVGEDRKVYLLDLASKEQEDMMHLMQRRYVRENFLSPENQYYQKSEEKEDIYGFGKMIQYVLSSVELEPELKFLERVRIQKIITRCLDKQGKKRYQKLSDLSGQFSLSEKRNGSKKIMYVMIALAVIGLLVLSGNRIVSCISGQSRRQGEQDTKLADTERKEDMKAQAYQEQFQELKEQWETERKELQDESSKREQELLYDLAFVYFSQMKDYEVCSRYLEEMKEPDAFAKDMVRLCGMMSRADGEDDNTEKQTEDEDESVEMLLERMRQEIPDEEDERYAECIEFAKEQLQKEDVVEEQTSGEES